jgi:hypothetical protein
MLIFDLQYEIYASNVTKSHEAKTTWTLSPFILQDHDIINRSEFDEVSFELCQLQIVWKSSYEYFSQLWVYLLIWKESSLRNM